uniref:4-galactosyl-N-acetylglucosaminide 3-alpha-L-fucosyltransferase 9-like n=1 Tax=Styela clava TaxID=7725 RepID=UPI00193A240E|nr:4-galactosyl-N-acetylglucosaminide 3-alpha-L-fucosyltransferase 9-like [Styela clava]
MQSNSRKFPIQFVLFLTLLLGVVIWILAVSRNCLYENYSKYFVMPVNSTELTSTLQIQYTEQWPKKERTDFNLTVLQNKLEERLKEATDKKIIVIWTAGIPLKGGVVGGVCGNCEVTLNRTMISDNKTAAVVVYFTGATPENMPPLRSRNPNHLYVYWTLESSSSVRFKYHRNLRYEDEYGFNATMTYRRDSDFPDKLYSTNSVMAIVKSRNVPKAEELLKLKTKKSLVVVSDCAQHSVAKQRIRLIKKIIAKGYELEGYGGCFPKQGKFADGAKRDSQEFFRAIRAYKFYFSFENSYHCKDYITEKFFKNAFHSYTVPVVWGATKKDYLAFAPAGSFIYAEDFETSNELIEYLRYLDQNATAYLEYFQWHNMDPDMVPGCKSIGRICQLCRALYGINFDDIHNPNFDPENHPRPLFDDGVSYRPAISVRDWLYHEDNKECFDKYY